MCEKEFLEEFAKILEEEKVDMEDCLEDFDGWDSLAVMTLFRLYEKNQKKVFLKDVLEAEYVKDLWQLF